MNKCRIVIAGLFMWLCFSNIATANNTVVITCKNDRHEVRKDLISEHFDYFRLLLLGSFKEVDEITWINVKEEESPCVTLDAVINFLHSSPDESGAKQVEIELAGVFSFLYVMHYYQAKDSFVLPVLHEIRSNFGRFDEDTQKEIKSTIEFYGFKKQWDGANSLEFEVNGVMFTFVKIPGGTFMFGEDNEQREIKVAPFMMMSHGVTQKQWEAIMGYNKSHFKGEDLPVECVSYNEVQEFIPKLNEFLAEQGLSPSRLPTEEEWEYAARAGTKTSCFWGDNPNEAKKYAWYRSNSAERAHSVATKLPNPWGLYDTSGNVWEWTDSLRKENIESRVIRGGCWSNLSSELHSAVLGSRFCDSCSGHLGFRLLRTSDL